MDTERFDRFAKSLAAGVSRRRLVGGLVALAAVGRGMLGPEAASAQGTPILPDGSGVTIQANCQGKPAANNRRCVQNPCAGGGNCFCWETITGDNSCVNIGNLRCPKRDECDRNRECGGGEVCIKIGGCCGHPERNACAPLCG